MKKNANDRKKLKLDVTKVRTLTDTELKVVDGGENAGWFTVLWCRTC